MTVFMDSKKMVTILGPTASGKTAVAVALACETGGEIISADSRQVYRRMDIGTGKDLGEYVCGGKRIACHLIDIVEPGSRYNLFQYQQDFHKALAETARRGSLPILCGGTGLYLEAVLKSYSLSPVPQDPRLRAELADKSLAELAVMLESLKSKNGTAMHNTTDVDTAQRAIRAIEIETYNLQHPTPRRQLPEVRSLVVGIDISRELRREKITRRLRQRLDNGMVEEIRGLLGEGISPDDLIYYGLEYKYVTEYVIGRLTFDEMFGALETAIHQFAKRQMTWFRGMERRGTRINWIDAELPMEEKVRLIMRMMNEKHTRDFS